MKSRINTAVMLAIALTLAGTTLMIAQPAVSHAMFLAQAEGLSDIYAAAGDLRLAPIALTGAQSGNLATIRSSPPIALTVFRSVETSRSRRE